MFWGYQPDDNWFGSVVDEETAVILAEDWPDHIFFKAELVMEDED